LQGSVRATGSGPQRSGFLLQSPASRRQAVRPDRAVFCSFGGLWLTGQISKSDKSKWKMADMEIINPYEAKRYEYMYPNNLYFRDQVAYGRFDVDIFGKPNPNYVSVYNTATNQLSRPTGIIIETKKNVVSEWQRQTIGAFLTRQTEVGQKVVDRIIPFYNDTVLIYRLDWEESQLSEFGAVLLLKNDWKGVTERLFLHNVFLQSSGDFGDFSMDFEWNLDCEHTITAKFKNWEIEQFDQTSEINY
jgi:hypothetical protein